MPDWLYDLILTPEKRATSESIKPRSDGETVVHIVDFTAERDFSKRVNRAALDKIDPASLGGREERRGAGQEEEARAEASAAEPIFDPWEECVVPKFPLDILPSPVERFVSE